MCECNFTHCCHVPKEKMPWFGEYPSPSGNGKGLLTELPPDWVHSEDRDYNPFGPLVIFMGVLLVLQVIEMVVKYGVWK